MNRLTTTDRATSLDDVTKTATTKLNAATLCYDLLDQASQTHPAKRADLLHQILDGQVTIPTTSLAEVLNEIVLASYDLSEEKAWELTIKIVGRLEEILQMQTVDDASSALCSVTNSLLTASITRSQEFITDLQSMLVQTAGKCQHEMYAEFLFDEITKRSNLTYTNDLIALIKDAAQLIPTLPGKRQLDAVLVLYRSLPDNPQQRITGLEAIMAHAGMVPDSHDSFTVLNIINAEVYKTRLSLL